MKIRKCLPLSALIVVLCLALFAAGCVPMGAYGQGMYGYYGNQQDYYGYTQGDYHGGGFDTNGWGSAQNGFGMFGGQNNNVDFGSSVYSSYAEAVKAFQNYGETINKKNNNYNELLMLTLDNSIGSGLLTPETNGTLFDINGDGSNELILYMRTIDIINTTNVYELLTNINFSLYIYTETNGKAVPVTIPDDLKIKAVENDFMSSISSLISSSLDEFTDYYTAYINGTPCLIKCDYGTLSGGDGKTEKIYVCTSNGNGIGINTVLEKKTRTEPVEKAYYSIDGREISESEYNDYINMIEIESSFVKSTGSVYTLDDLLVVLGDTW